ncbi:MAG: hypothetical protein ACYTFG_13930 [Planctomycetota bacterium]
MGNRTLAEWVLSGPALVLLALLPLVQARSIVFRIGVGSACRLHSVRVHELGTGRVLQDVKVTALAYRYPEWNRQDFAAVHCWVPHRMSRVTGARGGVHFRYPTSFNGIRFWATKEGFVFDSSQSRTSWSWKASHFTDEIVFMKPRRNRAVPSSGP